MHLKLKAPGQVLTILVCLIISSTAVAKADNNSSLRGAVAELRTDVTLLEMTNDAQTDAIEEIHGELAYLESGLGVASPRAVGDRQIIATNCDLDDDRQEAIDNAHTGFVRIEITGTCSGNFAIARDGIELRGVDGANIVGSVVLDAARNTSIQSLSITGSGNTLSLNNYSTVPLILATIETVNGDHHAVTAWSSKVIAGWYSVIRNHTVDNSGSAVLLTDTSSLEYIGRNLTISADAGLSAEAVRVYSHSRFLMPVTDGAVSIVANALETRRALVVGPGAMFSQSLPGRLNIHGNLMSAGGTVLLRNMTQTGVIEAYNTSHVSILEGGSVQTEALALGTLSHVGVSDGNLILTNEGRHTPVVSSSVAVSGVARRRHSTANLSRAVFGRW